MDRRQFLLHAAAAGLLPAVYGVRAAGSTVSDNCGLNPVTVAAIRRPRSTDEIRSALRETRGAVSIGGGRFSMGGQIAAPDSLHLDLRQLDQAVWIDAPGRRARVQAGMRWRDLQDLIDPRDLSVRIMQSYSNFTVGGSVSVNCHGRYVGMGPLIRSIRALQMVGADGEVFELSRTIEPELFRAVVGGYGGLGVVTEVELDLADNEPIERTFADVGLEEYPRFFRERVLADPRAVLHNADLRPPSFDRPLALTWSRSSRPVTQPLRLIPRGLDYGLERNAIWAITELPGGSSLRGTIEKVERARDTPVVWRNHEASLDAASLEPRSRRVSTYLLQEYFVPEPAFVDFARDLARILRVHAVEALNVSVRHSPADTETLLKWAPQDVFSFVLYFKQRATQAASEQVRGWTRKLIDASLQRGGRYYLPYRPDATRAQFAKAYPEARAFAALKRRIDPRGRFTNLMWDHYLRPYG
jgi:FAD/FMN-containing dehydrogenase